jgi:hypothetical protein
MAFRERRPPKELLYQNRSPKRSPRASVFDPAKRSLVNCNHLATSDTKLAPEETLAERLARKTKFSTRRAAQRYLHKQLKETLRGIALRTQSDDLDAAWDGQESPDKGPWRASRDYRRLDACQSQWIGFKARCCGSRAVAVPIGCNHRLCPLCNAARLEHYRGPARDMLAGMENPTFLTLTVPNTSNLTKKTFSQIRGWWKVFQRKNAHLLRGGLYSVEVTYNRAEKTFHPHLHILFDSPWPVRGVARSTFLTIKKTLEFDWLRITSPEAKRVFRRNEYQRWNKEAAQQERGSDWNKRYRRVVDIRPVQKGDGAVYEVIKYISKTNRFLDLAEAVEPYLRAIRGVRVLQTFGSFYNFKMEVPVTQAEVEEMAAAGIDAAPVKASTFLHCECGMNHFERIGVFSMADVEMDVDGRWLIRPQRERRRCRGSATNGGNPNGND